MLTSEITGDLPEIPRSTCRPNPQLQRPSLSSALLTVIEQLEEL